MTQWQGINEGRKAQAKNTGGGDMKQKIKLIFSVITLYNLNNEQ